MVSKNTARIANLALRNNTMAAIDEDRSIELARNTVLNTDSATIQARLDRYQQTYSASGKTTASKGFKNLQAAFKDTFDVPADKNPEAFRQFQDVLSQEALMFDTNEDALDMTKRDMTSIWQTSKYTAEKDQLMKFPPELIPMADQGQWLDNYIKLEIHSSNQRVAQKPKLEAQIPQMRERMSALKAEFGGASLERQDEIEAESIALIKDAAIATFVPDRKITIKGLDNIPEKMTSDELFSLPLSFDPLPAGLAVPGAGLFGGTQSVKGRNAEIDGFKTRWYLKSLPETGTRTDGKLTYGLAVIDKNGYEVFYEDPQNQSGILEITLGGLNDFLPETAQKLSDKTITQISRKEAKERFKKKRNELSTAVKFLSSTVTPVLQGIFVDQQAPAIADEIREGGQI